MQTRDKTTKSYSLFTILTIIVVISISFFVVFIATYNYFTIKAELQKDLRVKAQVMVSRAQHSLPHLIETYAINEYEKLIASEMLDRNVYAVLFNNKHMSEILKNTNYISGKIRNSRWEMESYQEELHKNLLVNDTLFVTKAKLFNSNGIELGSFDVYLTKKFINLELRKYFIYSLISIVLMALIVFLILYFSIHRFVLTPLENITNFISQRDHNNIPIKNLHLEGSKETLILANTINQMLDSIKLSNQQLEKERMFLKNLIEAAPIRIFWKDKNGVYLGANKLFIKDAGLKSPNEIIGKTDFELPWKDTEAKLYIADDQTVIDSKEAKLNIEETQTKDGTKIHLITSKVPLFDNDGNVHGVLGIYDDITQRLETENKMKQHEIQLIQQSRLAQMGEMIAMIAHQWRQPLNTISITAGAITYKLQKDILDKNYFEEKCQLITNQVGFLSTTIDDFRNFFKPDKEKQKVFSRVLIDETLKIVKPTLEQSNVTVNITSNCGKEVETYINEVKQVILNILQNSQDAFIENKTQNPVITIGASCSTTSACEITIEDNGGGISKEIVEKVFDPYFSTKVDKNGTGLGLYMSKIIIEDHCQGTLKVKSGGCNTKFIITL